MTLDTETITALAKEIARAQVTASDDYVDEMIAGWDVEHQAKIGRAGDHTSQDRLNLFHSKRGEIERTIEKEKNDHEAAMESIRKSQEAAEARDAQTIAANQARYDADIARHHADCLVARQNGRQEPAAPNPDAYALTREAVAMEAHREIYRRMF